MDILRFTVGSFNLHNGSLIDLKIDFEAKLKTIQELYDLGHFPNNSTN